MNNTVLELNNVSKKYNKHLVLDNISMKINKGDIYGLIGRNGAGKTTIMKIITNLIQETSGEVVLLQENKKTSYSTSLQRIGAIIEEPAAYVSLSAYNNMKASCIQKGVHDYSIINELLDLVDLTNTGKKVYSKFSLGMKQRLGIAMALVNNPDFLILDEPINGLDPIAIIEFREILEKINKERNITILISSHILVELYQLSTRFGFIHNGKIIEEISKESFDLKCSESILLEIDNIEKAVICIKDNYNNKIKIINNTTLLIYGELKMSELNVLMVKNEIEVTKLTKYEDSLESYYTNLIKDMEEKQNA